MIKMGKTGYVAILVTASGKEEAQKIGRVLLEKRLAACVNLVSGIESKFWWQGKIDSAEEVLLIIKARASAVAAIVKLVRENHSYTVPEIIALPIVGGNPDYLEWIRRETGD